MRTKIGMLIRAGASNREMIGALGINIKLLFTLVFGLGAALAGLAGLMQAPILTVQIGMGENILILAFVITVIGGIGSIRGAFVAALLRRKTGSARKCQAHDRDDRDHRACASRSPLPPCRRPAWR
jgi:branched-subunit amino acid ABC-type transport system permease component